jgi:hypothetical protein
MIDTAQLLATLTPPAQLSPTRGTGVYALALHDQDALPLVTPGREGLLYVGMTEDSLEVRNHFIHQHSGFSSLRRSLGALLKDRLGLRAVRRARGASRTNVVNYRFEDAGEQRLTDWMRAHLLAAQAPVAAGVRAIEKAVIAELEPPLNLTGWTNPQRGLVKAVRAACVREAAGQ